MCIGIPMQVVSVEPGHAEVAGRGETRRVRTALVGDVAPGDWLLIFIDSAQEVLDATRVLEINATLDLLQTVMRGEALDTRDAAHDAFELPSRWSVEDLRALSGSLAPVPVPAPESTL